MIWQRASKLVSHLQSPEFFNTAEFGTASFKITSTEGGVVKGDLTIKGITHEAIIKNINLEEKDGAIVTNGTLTFDRQAYGISWKHYMKDMTLSDNIELEINISGIAG